MREVKLYLSKDFLSWAMHASFLLAQLSLKPSKRPRLTASYVNIGSPSLYKMYASLLREEGLQAIEEAVSRKVESLPSVAIDGTLAIRGRYVFARGAMRILKWYPWIDYAAFAATTLFLVGAVLGSLTLGSLLLGQAFKLFHAYLLFIFSSITLAIIFSNVYTALAKLLLRLLASTSTIPSTMIPTSLSLTPAQLCRRALVAEASLQSPSLETVEALEKARLEILLKRHDWLRCVVYGFAESIEKMRAAGGRDARLLRELEFSLKLANAAKLSLEKRASSRGCWLCQKCGALNPPSEYRCRVCSAVRQELAAFEGLSPLHIRILRIIAEHGGEAPHSVLISELGEDKPRVVEAVKFLYSRKLISPVLLTFEGRPAIGYKLSEEARKLASITNLPQAV